MKMIENLQRWTVLVIPGTGIDEDYLALVTNNPCVHAQQRCAVFWIVSTAVHPFRMLGQNLHIKIRQQLLQGEIV